MVQFSSSQAARIVRAAPRRDEERRTAVLPSLHLRDPVAGGARARGSQTEDSAHASLRRQRA